ncbi:MAG TPA: hypothetical protein HPP51_00835 [Planctomycetes bacterium]|nr:hypothetical protein [Planctomycetota bacterium]
MTDSTKLGRTAQQLLVQIKRGYGSPPNYGTQWMPVYDAIVDTIEINYSATPSRATILFPDLRWQQSYDLIWGDRVLVTTAQRQAADRAVLFSGFAVRVISGYDGGSGRSKSYEENALLCYDHRWIMSVSSPVYGQVARTADDYNDYGTDSQTPILTSATWLSGRNTIFNAEGRPNRDLVEYTITDSSGQSSQVPIFGPTDSAIYWSARDMVIYLLAATSNQADDYFSIANPAVLTGLDNTEWNARLNHINVQGLSNVEAVAHIAAQVGWEFREEYDSDGLATLVFYKVGGAAGSTRSVSNPTIQHTLHAPAVGEDISTAVAAGKKMLRSLQLDEDITPVVNNPWAIGGVHRFEFTAELVPAWQDSLLEPDTSGESNENLFFTEADLQQLDDPAEKSVYNYYHTRSPSLRRNVGRKWALNESGRYTGSGSYDRGSPFDFSSVMPADLVLDGEGQKRYAPFTRRLLNCLTADTDSLGSIGIKVEFSFDSGSSWLTIPCSIRSLKDECGIYIDEANLAEMAPEVPGTISGGDLDGIELNYWTSLCDDKINSRVFKNGEWHTRVRVTATVAMDTRLDLQLEPSVNSGSPFHQRYLYDLSDKYRVSKRTTSSTFHTSSLVADEADDGPYLNKHLEAIRAANQDMAISGRFVLDRMWLGGSVGNIVFEVGDGIANISGRDYLLRSAFNNKPVYPEIVQILYEPSKQIQTLITRDLRFARPSI